MGESPSRSAPFSPQELRQLQAIWSLMQSLEKNWDSEKLSEQKDFSNLLPLLAEIEKGPHEICKKLGALRTRIHGDLTLKQFTPFLLPFERALGRSVSDEQFLVHTEDKKQISKSNREADAEVIFVLDHLRSAFNVGSLIRTADSVGASRVDLIGYTPGPEDAAVGKTSMGSEKNLKFKRFEKLTDSLQDLKKQGYTLVALETAEKSQSLFAVHFPKKVAFVVGNERFGLENSQLSEMDSIVSIPMFGFKNSLNVGVSLAIVAFEWARQASTTNPTGDK